MFQHLTYEQHLDVRLPQRLPADNQQQKLHQQLSRHASQDLDAQQFPLVYRSQLSTHHRRQLLNHQSVLQ